jgi:hypothetical protein
MRFSIAATALAIVSLASVQASPVENEIAKYEIMGSHHDAIQTLPGQNYTSAPAHLNAAAASSCGSKWYYTRCNYYCPCGWYYYNSGSKKCNGYCYDTKHKGCKGTCPSGTHTYCGTCKKA